MCKGNAAAAAGQYPLNRLVRQGCFQQGRQIRAGLSDGTACPNDPLLHLFAAVHPICCCHSCGPKRYLSCMVVLLCRDLQEMDPVDRLNVVTISLLLSLLEAYV